MGTTNRHRFPRTPVEGQRDTTTDGDTPLVSVLMPTFKQAAYIERAIESLLAQTLTNWELVIVDDGSPDDTEAVVAPYLVEPRIRYARVEENVGLGAALNIALGASSGEYIAYLPSDDVYYETHLTSLVGCLQRASSTVLAYSGVRHEVRTPGTGAQDRSSRGSVADAPLQLVQVMHRRTRHRWLERRELVTDDLDRIFWQRLRADGGFAGTGQISCEWLNHRHQHHKLLQEPRGGLNPYRSYYGVQEPLRIHTSRGALTDEVEHYRRFRERPAAPLAPDGLKILLAGELAFNPDRVLALEERGHKLYGLWTPDVQWYNTVGPLPFGHVEDIPREGWRESIERIAPDVIYALLNWETVPFAHHVLTNNPGIPFIWHFKEGPFDCLANDTWPMLSDLYRRSDGQIYGNPEVREWFEAALPGVVANGRSIVLDGDLPKADWFDIPQSERLSKARGGVHTVLAGNPIGIKAQLIADLAAQDIHFHFYGGFHRNNYAAWIEEVKQHARGHLHLHDAVGPEAWVAELSQYDAGWLHIFESQNGGDVRRANWDDLNYPARIPTLASAGLPLIQRNNGDALVASQSLTRDMDIGLFFDDADDLAHQLYETQRMDELRANAWRGRRRFTFDHHAERLLAFLREVIASRRPALV